MHVRRSPSVSSIERSDNHMSTPHARPRNLYVSLVNNHRHSFNEWVNP